MCSKLKKFFSCANIFSKKGLRSSIFIESQNHKNNEYVTLRKYSIATEICFAGWIHQIYWILDIFFFDQFSILVLYSFKNNKYGVLHLCAYATFLLLFFFSYIRIAIWSFAWNDSHLCNLFNDGIFLKFSNLLGKSMLGIYRDVIVREKIRKNVTLTETNACA